MLRIDRIEIDDAGGNPAKLAKALLRQIAGLKPPVPVREIAEALGIYEIREEPLSGLEGCLITPDDKSEGAILVHKDRPETRKRYTIGHELGHYINPWHKAVSAEGFRCSSKDMRAESFKAGDRTRQMEVEANKFSADLLMPEKLFQESINRFAGVDIDHILSIADKYVVSREATARRYVEFSDEPIAAVFSKNGIIRYVKKPKCFPMLDVWNNDLVPTPSVSARSTLAIGNVSDWDVVEGGVWLRNAGGRRICEQTLAQANGFRLTLLTLEEPSEDEGEADDDKWAPPTFHR